MFQVFECKRTVLLYKTSWELYATIDRIDQQPTTAVFDGGILRPILPDRTACSTELQTLRCRDSKKPTTPIEFLPLTVSDWHQHRVLPCKACPDTTMMGERRQDINRARHQSKLSSFPICTAALLFSAVVALQDGVDPRPVALLACADMLTGPFGWIRRLCARTHTEGKCADIGRRPVRRSHGRSITVPRHG